MSVFSRIAVATDLSDCSLPAVHKACELANTLNAELHVVSVVPYPVQEFLEICQKEIGKSLDECEAKHFLQWQQQLNELSLPSAPAKTIRKAVRGLTVDEICEYVTKCNVDLLVVGTHGRTGLKHMLMGSVAETLVRKAPCPVLTVRSHKSEDKET